MRENKSLVNPDGSKQTAETTAIWPDAFFAYIEERRLLPLVFAAIVWILAIGVLVTIVLSGGTFLDKLVRGLLLVGTVLVVGDWTVGKLTNRTR